MFPRLSSLSSKTTPTSPSPCRLFGSIPVPFAPVHTRLDGVYRRPQIQAPLAPLHPDSDMIFGDSQAPEPGLDTFEHVDREMALKHFLIGFGTVATIFSIGAYGIHKTSPAPPNNYSIDLSREKGGVSIAPKDQ